MKNNLETEAPISNVLIHFFISSLFPFCPCFKVKPHTVLLAFVFRPVKLPWFSLCFSIWFEAGFSLWFRASSRWPGDYRCLAIRTKETALWTLAKLSSSSYFQSREWAQSVTIHLEQRITDLSFSVKIQDNFSSLHCGVALSFLPSSCSPYDHYYFL